MQKNAEQDTCVYLAIGSNIEPLRQIPRCLGMLAEIPESSLFAQSSWYRTLPWGVTGQAGFINLVVGMTTGLSPHGLLRQTQAIEARLDRVRTVKNGPRTMDLDILLYGDLVLCEDDLSLPHPGLLLRDFMLAPLIEIAPEVVHPLRGRPLRLLGPEIRYRQIVERLKTNPRPSTPRVQRPMFPRLPLRPS